ncbi:MAG: hypothetical protein JWO86_5227 [Myxococcaceae bacterium]|nr:hypothetical protein [Myxococcaceae bacterium]
MLPNRKSAPAPRRSPAIAVEVRVPVLGTSFGALAATVRPEGVFLSTFQVLEAGTAVIMTVSLSDGPVVLDGIVVEQGDPAGMGIAVELVDIDDTMRMRLTAASSIAPPAPDSVISARVTRVA